MPRILVPPRALRNSEDAMARSNHLPKLRIALLFGVALMPALSLAQSAQVSPLPKAPRRKADIVATSRNVA
jgi:hypothetical protein